MAYPKWGVLASCSMQKVGIVVRVNNKPDSAIIRIAERAKRRDRLLLQIRNIIAALMLTLNEYHKMEHDRIHSHVVYMFMIMIAA